MSYSALATTPAHTCPYCGHGGGDVPYAGAKLHAGCYFAFGEELAIFDSIHHHKEPRQMSKPVQYVRVRIEDPEPLPDGNEGYAIEDKDGKVLGYSPSVNGPEQRAAVAKVLGVDESEITYKGEDEDDNGPVEVWGLKGVAAPVAA